MSGALETVAILPEVSEVANCGLDVTPARVMTAPILSLYPEQRSRQSV